MHRQPHSLEREIIVADAIGPVVSELRMVELADYVAFIRMERFANISDLVDSAAELYFMPGTVRLGHGGEAHVSWTDQPRIVLDLELRPRGATVYAKLTMDPDIAGIEVNYVAFDEPNMDPERNSEFLRSALDMARVKGTADAIGL